MTDSLRRAGLLVLAIAFLVLPIRSLIVEGPFDWHVAQAAAIEGGLEAIGLFGCVLLGLALPARRAGACIVALATWLFARRHGVDASIILVVLYAEGVFALGWRLLPFAGFAQRARPGVSIVAGVLGVIAWSLVAWTLALAGAQTPSAFRFAALGVLGIALLVHRGPSLSGLAWRAVRRASGWSRVAAAFAGAFVVVLFAKASVVIDYDSLWYGLRGESVLLGEGGLFRNQGLVAVVHYYPKLYEVLLLPFAGLDSTSLVFGVGILSSLLVAATVVAIVGALGVRGPLRLLAGVLAMTVPALANMAVSAKGDAFSAWLMFVGVYALLRLRNSGAPRWFWVGLATAGLSLLCRLSNMPYAALLVLMLAGALMPAGQWRNAWRDRGARVFAAAVVLAGIVTWRSWLVAGVPLIAPNAIVGLEQQLGFTLAYPVALLPGGSTLPTLPVLSGLWQFLFAPAALPHVMITWTGNAWAWLPLVALLLGGRVRPTSRDWPLLAIGLLFFPVLFSYRHPIPGGDGNYFIVPIIALLAWGIVRVASARSRAFVPAVVFAFVLAQAAVAFVTGSWGPGTRPLDTTYTRTPDELRMRGDHEIPRARLAGVAHFFDGMPAGTRVVGMPDPDVRANAPVEWFLGVRYEPLDSVADQRPALVADVRALTEFLRTTRVAYVVLPEGPALPHAPTPRDALAALVRQALAARIAEGSAREAFRDADYVVFALDANAAQTVALAGGGEASLAYDTTALCSAGTAQVATIAWHGTAQGVAIEVRAPGAAKATLFAQGPARGHAKTGQWVAPGAEFIVRAGRAGPVLGVLRARCD